MGIEKPSWESLNKVCIFMYNVSEACNMYALRTYIFKIVIVSLHAEN